MSQTTQGTCLCGAVAFEIEGEFERFFLCHCSRCRKGTGSAHAANLFSSNARLHWLAGEDKVKTFTVPGTRHTRSFCNDCGGALPKVKEKEGRVMLVVPAGCLDSPVALRPVAHICMDSKADWDEALETVPKLPGLPG